MDCSRGRRDIIPSVQSWSMALMIRSHSSARVRHPHSPSRGTYRSSFCSSSIKGTLWPSSSGNVAAETQGQIRHNCKLLKAVTLDFVSFFSLPLSDEHRVSYHHQGWVPYPKDSSSLCLHYPSWMGNRVELLSSSSSSPHCSLCAC